MKYNIKSFKFFRGHATPNAFEKSVVSLQDRGQWQRRDKVVRFRCTYKVEDSGSAVIKW